MSWINSDTQFEESDSDLTSSGSGDIADRAVEWKNICFLPFKMLWKVMIVVIVFMEILLVSYTLMFEARPQTTLFWTVYYIFEVMYAIDTGLLTAHKFLVTHQKKRIHVPKNYFRLTVDILTLTPYYETYYLLTRASKGKGHDFAKDTLKWKVIPRIYRIPAFFFSISNTPGLNHIPVDTLAYVTYFLLYSVLGACLWHYMTVDNPDFNWAVTFLQYHNFNNESSISWFIISCNVIGNVFAHNWSGLIFAARNVEYAILVTTMLLGFLNHYMILFGRLTALYMKKIGDQFRFSSKLWVVQRMMADWEIAPTTQKEVIEVYNSVWEQRSGIMDRPKMARLLPKSLKKEISLDVFWAALKHSPIFGDLDVAVKRHLSSHMRNSFLMPGEYLLKVGEMKSRMIYVVSGIVQILSQEDGKSAIMSFSSGTLFGETSTLLPIASTVNLNCGSYCELNTLDFCAVWRVLRKYPRAAAPLREKHKERFETARSLQHPDLLKLKLKDKKTTDIRWIKGQWRNLCHQTKGGKKRLEEKHEMVTIHHTSKYLNLYVLSEEVELKVKTICLKSTFPYVLEPTSSFRKTFEYMILGSVIIQTIILPYMLFFEKNIKLHTYAIFYTLDCFYILGLVLDVSTAVKKSDRIISTVGQILIYKGKQISFLIDILATLPFELLGVSFTDPIYSLLRVNRLLKIYKVFVIIRKAELNVWAHYIQIRTIKYLTVIICAVYFGSAFCYGMTSFPEMDYNGWLFYNQGLEELLGTKSERELSHFLLSIQYILTIVLSQQWRSYFAYSATDIFVELVVVIVGYFIYSFCFAEVGACAVLSHQAVTDYQSYLATLTDFANKRRVPNSIRYFMYSMVQCQWEYNGRFDVAGPRSVIRQLPERLRNEVLFRRVVRVLRLIPVFFECDEDVLWRVAAKMTINVFPPGSVLVQQDCFSTNLYVIVRGHCLAESYIPTDKYHEAKTNLTVGDCFPLLEMLMFIDSFARVAAQTYVEIAAISYGDLMNALDKEGDLYRDLQTTLRNHYAENKVILSRQKGRLPEMVSMERSAGRGDFFEYEIDDSIVRVRDRTYNLVVWKKLDTWRCLRHLLLKNTLDPLKRAYLAWECFRCVVAIAHVVCSLSFVHYTTAPKWYHYINRTFLCVAAVDFYVRMHCRYHDGRGVLVTHPLYTARHYLGTSFLLDLFAVLPVRELQLERLFGARRRRLALLALTVATRPFLLHRVFSGVTYLQKRSPGRAVLYHNAKCVVVVLVAVAVAAVILEGVSCQREFRNGEMAHACPNGTWIYGDLFREDQHHPYMTSLICYYVVMSVFTTSTVGLFTFERKPDVLCMAFLSFMLLAIRWFMLAKITSSRIGGNTTLVHYQHNMKEFIKFSKKYYLKSALVDETVSHFEYIWKRTKGSSISNILPSFHPVLRADFCAFFYEPTMKITDVLCDLETSAVKYIAPHFKEWHFKKDADIVRCNDVTDKLYIVHRGSVEVKIANDRLALLTQGGMFGSFSRNGRTRLTITARAKIHVDLMVINVKKFYEVISRYKSATGRMTKNRLLKAEFVAPISDPTAASATIVDQSAEMVQTKNRSAWRRVLMFTVDSDNEWLSLYNYVLNVHVSTISSMVVMTFIAKVGYFDIANYSHLCYLFDVVFVTKLVLGFHTTNVDPDSGLVISKFSRIWRRHARSPHFWYNVVATLPFEVVYYFVRNENLYRYCWANRVLRFSYLIRYYNNCKNTLTVSKHLRWTYLMYSMVFIIHTNACIWWKIACPEEVCRFYPKVSHEPITLESTERTVAAFGLSYVYVINVFTSTGLRMIVPTNTQELITSIVMIGFSQLVMVVLTAGFASMLVLDKFEMTSFEKGARKVVKYLIKVNLSISLKRKLWQYYVEQWTRAHGQWLPVLIESSPSYLKEDIMHNLYSKHVLNHFLFKKTHTDFIRQLTVHLKLLVFLPGMYLVEKGDVDGCMYFINEGEIVVYDVFNKLEIEMMALTAGSSFGEPQGLYNVPHERTYKARYITKVLTLTKGTWEYLMDWFPASKEQILEQSARRFKPRLSA